MENVFKKFNILTSRITISFHTYSKNAVLLNPKKELQLKVSVISRKSTVYISTKITRAILYLEWANVT